jgi:hypothetical protein
MGYRPETTKGGEEIWKTDRLPIEKRFTCLGKFESCWWQSGALGKDSGRVPGPSVYFLTGFVLLQALDAEKIFKKYEWEESAYKVSVPKEIMPVFSGKWLISETFRNTIKSEPNSEFRKGEVYYLPEKGLVFLNLTDE